jgi:Ca-activated chloride channel homolog
MEYEVGNPNYLWLLSAALIGLVLALYAILVRRRAALLFATAQSLPQLFTVRSHWPSAILLAGCLALLAVSLMDIRIGKSLREVPQKGIEVVFLLDVSRSMLAEDATPNRLARAKQQIKDMLDEMTGDRVGLVVFAGESRQIVPLTSHYEDFKQALDAVGPNAVRRGGSRLGDALTAAANAFISKTNDHKVIVVFTDGEDQESQPSEIAKKLRDEKQTRIFTVGLGDMDQGAKIPDTQSGREDFVQYQGQPVWSKMNGEVLSQIATETGGAYIPAGTKRVNMSDVYHRFIADVEQTEFSTAKINAYIPRFRWFALPALGLLVLEVLISTRKVETACAMRPAPSKIDQGNEPLSLKGSATNHAA